MAFGSFMRLKKSAESASWKYVLRSVTKATFLPWTLPRADPDRVAGAGLARRDELPVGGVRGGGERPRELGADVAEPARVGRGRGGADLRRHGRRLDRAGVGEREAALRERARRLVREA